MEPRNQTASQARVLFPNEQLLWSRAFVMVCGLPAASVLSKEARQSIREGMGGGGGGMAGEKSRAGTTSWEPSLQMWRCLPVTPHPTPGPLAPILTGLPRTSFFIPAAASILFSFIPGHS